MVPLSVDRAAGDGHVVQRQAWVPLSTLTVPLSVIAPPG